jgi:hypothetical protein
MLRALQRDHSFLFLSRRSRQLVLVQKVWEPETRVRLDVIVEEGSHGLNKKNDMNSLSIQLGLLI